MPLSSLGKFGDLAGEVKVRVNWKFHDNGQQKTNLAGPVLDDKMY